MDLINDSSNVPIVDVSSYFRDALVSGSSSLDVVDDDTLVNDSSNPHVADAFGTMTLLFSDDGDSLHDSLAPGYSSFR